MERTLGQRLTAEFIGAATLIFIGAGAIVQLFALTDQNNIVHIALAHGLAIAVMVSALGHISGGHFNPAVTIGMLATAKITLRDAVFYVLAQLAGATVAAAALRTLVHEQVWKNARLGVPGLLGGLVDTGQAVVIEAILTFFLVWVIFATAVDPDGAFGKIAGLAIGLTITAGVLMGGAFTGAAMNPARWFGPALVGGYWENSYVWLVGPIAGGIVAASIYDWLILSRRGAGGSAVPENGEEEALPPAPHGWGAHGEDADAVHDHHHEE